MSVIINIKHFVLIFCYFVTVQSHRSFTQKSADDGTELLFTLLVHRHGDRTPVEDMMIFVGSEYSDVLQDLIEPWGYGQLTNVGRATGYELGKFIRRRYNSLLSPIYNKSQIYIRSTDSTRAKMTVLTAMSAVYPPVDPWSKKVNWVPVPYTTVPARYDFNLALINCPAYSSVYRSILLSNNPPALARYSGVMQNLSDIFGSSLIATFPGLSYPIYDLFVSEISLGIDLGEETMNILDELREVAGAAMDLIFGGEEYIGLQAGVLLNEFYKYSAKIIAGEDTPKVRVYSAHDVNVFTFAAVSKITPRLGYPHYGSLFALELRKVTETGQYVVLPVYLPSPNEPEQYLQVESCGILCDYDSFVNLTSPYALDEDTWRIKCGYTDDMEIDTSTID